MNARDPFDATTATGGAGVWVSLLAVMFVPTATTADPAVASTHFDATNSGVPIEQPEIAIAEIRRLSGLTWEQLAELCGTSRRTLHLWASGRPMQRANEERLHLILGVLRRIDRGSSAENREQLLLVRNDGRRILDLLIEGLYEAITELLAESTQSPSRAPAKRSATLPPDRRLPAPGVLLDARQDSIHIERGRHPKARSVRRRRGK
jgi:transcriptional regulator with XRE-family HTH domain